MDVNMFYYIVLLVIFSVLNIVYKEAEVFMDQWPGNIMQMTICYTQLMIIIGLCMDGGRSLTGKIIPS